MPLLEPVEVPAADTLGRIHFIAIGGSSMSGIAQVYAGLGHPVSGSDANDSAVLADLASRGIEVHVGHRAEQVGQADTVVYNSAIRPDNPELVAARQRGLRILHRSTALAALLNRRRSDLVGIAVSGTHGKTTTSAWLATALTALGRDPSYLVGAPIAANRTTVTDSFAKLGKGPDFVIEADESDGSFRQYPARIAVVTNVEADHLDNWGTREAYAAGFDEFAAGPSVEVAVVNADDAGARALATRIADRVRVVTYGEAEDADVRITEVDLGADRSSAHLSFDGTGGRIRISLLGRHNVSNAAAVYAVGRVLGQPDPAVRHAIERFAGTSRRFQKVGEVHQVRVYDDYAHNPTKVRSALQGARAAVGRGRLVVCFQPHLYSRTRDFADEFAAALSLADEVVVTGIYAAREDPLPGVSGELIADQVRTVRGRPAHYVADLAEAAELTASLARPWDLVMTVGAGSITTAGPMILAALDRR